MHRIFVYGTLRKGGSNFYLMKNAEFVTKAITRLGYQLLSMGGYPAMVPGNDAVVGEVYEVSDDTRDRLDALEGHPQYYTRTPIQVVGPGESAGILDVEAYIPLKPRKNLPVIEGGDWIAYVQAH